MKICAIFLFVCGISLTTYSQSERSNLKGPEFKNYKPWKNKRLSKSDNEQTVTIERVTGPEVKNYRPWRDTLLFNHGIAINSTAVISPRITGPQYKNRKPKKKRKI